jgi:hypothetical protein
MRYLTINDEQFPYENAQYSDTSRLITNQHLMYCFTPDVPVSRIDRMKQSGVIDIRDLAEDKVLTEHPEYEELTSYGTRKAGFYRLLNTQIKKTMFWALNKQPASFTIITNKIDGLTRKPDDITTTDTIYGKIQLCIQLGVTVQLVIPETGYSCVIPPVCNKKKMDIFTRHFICEKVIEQYESGELQDTELIAHMQDVYDKYDRLEEYRKAVQDSIWQQVAYALNPYRDEWKMQNIYTLDSRMQFAVDAETKNVLLKYNNDFKIPDARALTIEDLKNPETFNEMLRIISIYGPAFGISVKTSEGTSDTMTYMPHSWMRDDKNTITDAILLKQSYRIRQAMKHAPLNELLNAYIQIDWYMSQPRPEEFYVIGYAACDCGKPVRLSTTHYYNETRNKLYAMDEPAKYDYQYNNYDSEVVYPVTVCPYCGRIHTIESFDTLDGESYEILEYRLNKEE